MATMSKLNDWIQCPECKGRGENIIIGDSSALSSYVTCDRCDGKGIIQNRRKKTANDRIVNRIENYAGRTTEVNTDPCSVILNIIKEERA